MGEWDGLSSALLRSGGARRHWPDGAEADVGMRVSGKPGVGICGRGQRGVMLDVCSRKRPAPRAHAVIARIAMRIAAGMTASRCNERRPPITAGTSGAMMLSTRTSRWYDRPRPFGGRGGKACTGAQATRGAPWRQSLHLPGSGLILTQCAHLLFQEFGTGLIAGNRFTCHHFDLRAHSPRYPHSAQARVAPAPHARPHAAQHHPGSPARCGVAESFPRRI